MMKKQLLICWLLCMVLAASAREPADSVAREDLSGWKFKEINGDSLQISNLKGNIVVLDVWAMGCGECLMQFPALQKLEMMYKDLPVVFLALCIENNEKAWIGFVEKRKMAGRHIITPIRSPFLSENGIRGIPRTIILDKEGRVLVAHAEKPSDPLLKLFLDKLLNGEE